MIKADERFKIKSVIINLSLKSHPLVAAVLDAALIEIYKNDFPDNWPGLVPVLFFKNK